MLLFSDSVLTRNIVIISLVILWIITCWAAYIYGYRRGYAECMTNKLIKKRHRSHRKHSRDGDIHVLDPTDSRTRHAEAESVRIVGTRVPNYEEENIWL